MYRIGILLCLLTGCAGQTVRKTSTLAGEILWWANVGEQYTLKSSALLKAYCPCQTQDTKCLDLARIVSVVRVRGPWHRDFALYNSGLSQVRPSKTPPAIVPPAQILCPEIP